MSELPKIIDALCVLEDATDLYAASGDRGALRACISASRYCIGACTRYRTSSLSAAGTLAEEAVTLH